MSFRNLLKFTLQLILLAVASIFSVASTLYDYEYIPVDIVYVYDPVTDAWRQKESVSRPRIEPICQELGGIIYMIGGKIGYHARARAKWTDMYDPAADQWQSLTDVRIPVEDNYSAYCAVGEHIFVMGSCSERALTEEGDHTVHYPTLFAYDTAADAWALKADMPVLGQNGRCIVMGDEIYLVYLEPSPVMHKYDTVRDSWATCSTPPGSPVAANDKIYAVGCRDPLSRTYTDEVYEYDRATNRWTQRSSKPNSLNPGVMVAIGNKIYLFCEKDNPVEEYDTSSDVWEVKSDVPVPSNKGFAINGKIYLFSPDGKVAEYDPEADVWTWKSSGPSPPLIRKKGERLTWWYYYDTGNWVESEGKIYVLGGWVRRRLP